MRTKKYRLYQVIDNNINNTQEFGEYNNHDDVKQIATILHEMIPDSTFVINFYGKGHEVYEEYFGEYYDGK